ncbi:MliC family protein [Paenirhodobacter sp.]|uniref:MliC family protein n=1 Tax=Paenirhodobacter sp. TaxID=1965326 RepID=UPI003B504ED1
MILRSLPILIAPLIALAGTAQAEAVLSIPLPMGAEASVTRLAYSCDGDAIAVQYINTEANSLAILTLDGAERIFVGVTAGSGARYVSGPYEWWTKGADATLSELMTEGQPRSCTARP